MPRNRPRKRIPRHIRASVIVHHALLIVAEQGIDGLTMADLARKVGFTPGALYRYFPSKDAIIAMLQVRAMLVCRQQFDKAVQLAATEQLDDQAAALLPLLAAGGLHRELAARSPAEFGLLAIGLSDPRQLVADAEAKKVWLEATKLASAVAEQVELAQGCGALEPGDPFQRALMLVFGGHGVLQLGKLARRAPGLMDVNAMANELYRSLLMGWGASQQSVTAAEAVVADVVMRAMVFESDPDLAA